MNDIIPYNKKVYINWVSHNSLNKILPNVPYNYISIFNSIKAWGISTSL